MLVCWRELTSFSDRVFTVSTTAGCLWSLYTSSVLTVDVLLPVSLSVSHSACLSVCLSVSQSLSLPVCLSLPLSLPLSVCPQGMEIRLRRHCSATTRLCFNLQPSPSARLPLDGISLSCPSLSVSAVQCLTYAQKVGVKVRVRVGVSVGN